MTKTSKSNTETTARATKRHLRQQMIWHLRWKLSCCGSVQRPT